MRIVGGAFRGKKLNIPDDKRLRPTSDRTRESLFNILAHNRECRTEHGYLPLKSRVLDVFAGTGALGFEALSRGAEHITFMDNHPDSLRLIRENTQNLSAQRYVDILSRNGTSPGNAASPCDLVLMDPPYNEGLAEPCLKALIEGQWLKDDSVIVIELAAKEAFSCPDEFEIFKEKTYGAARLVFLKKL